MPGVCFVRERTPDLRGWCLAQPRHPLARRQPLPNFGNQREMHLIAKCNSDTFFQTSFERGHVGPLDTEPNGPHQKNELDARTSGRRGRVVAALDFPAAATTPATVALASCTPPPGVRTSTTTERTHPTSAAVTLYAGLLAPGMRSGRFVLQSKGCGKPDMEAM